MPNRSHKKYPFRVFIRFQHLSFRFGFLFFSITDPLQLPMLSVKIVQREEKAEKFLFHFEEKTVVKIILWFFIKNRKKENFCLLSPRLMSPNPVTQKRSKCVGFSIRLCFTIYSLLLTLFSHLFVLVVDIFYLSRFIASHLIWFILFPGYSESLNDQTKAHLKA